MSKPSNTKMAGKQKAESKLHRTEAQSRETSSASESSRTVTMDRRGTADRRKGGDRRQRNEPVAVERRVLQRREKVARRRQIDPTTCERDYSDAEVEFMNALDLYKRTNGRMFPTCSEILEVLRSLGYEKRTVPPAPAPEPDSFGKRSSAPLASDGTTPVSVVTGAVAAANGE